MNTLHNPFRYVNKAALCISVLEFALSCMDLEREIVCPVSYRLRKIFTPKFMDSFRIALCYPVAFVNHARTKLVIVHLLQIRKKNVRLMNNQATRGEFNHHVSVKTK